jgi:hypothetical protein
MFTIQAVLRHAAFRVREGRRVAVQPEFGTQHPGFGYHSRSRAPEQLGTEHGAPGQAGGVARAAAAAASGSAARMRRIAGSSRAAETNHASYTDGGRLTPALSITWKNGG